MGSLVNYIKNIDEIADMLKYIKGLKFEEKPNYRYLKELISNLMTSENIDYDYMYDWILPELQKEPIKARCQPAPMGIVPHYTYFSI